MAIAYRAGASNTGGSSITITKPTGTVSGDVMYALFLQDVTSGGLGVTLAGWTALGTVKNTPSNGFPTTLLRRVAGGSEGANYVFTVNGGSISEGCIWTYSGVDNTTPEDATTTEASGAVASIAYPSITVVTSGAVHLALSENFNALASQPTGYTQRTTGASWTTNSDKSVAGTVSGVTSTGGGDWVARSVLLRPASAGGVSGTVAYTNVNDTLSAAGKTTIIGTLAKTNANDTSNAAGTTKILGSLSYTNHNDTLAASGTSGSPITGTVNYTNLNDSLSAVGKTTVIGTLAYTNVNDTLVSAGWANKITGTIVYTNINDSSSISGNVGGVISMLSRYFKSEISIPTFLRDGKGLNTDD